VAAQFFIDGELQPLAHLTEHTYSFRVSAGVHTFLWLHHQYAESMFGEIRVRALPSFAFVFFFAIAALLASA
jgi:hypothetical protein